MARFSKAEDTEHSKLAGAEETPDSPLREIPLSSLQKRSSPLSLSHASLAHGLDSARRLDALEWLVQAFDALDLANEQLFSSIGLLDRYAAASNSPIAAGPGAFALVLAAMLIALKVGGFKKDLECARQLVVEVSGSSRPWAAVRKAELNILRKLSFRACTPTAYDLLCRLLGDLLEEDASKRCSNLAKFLLEMCIVYEPEALYGTGRPPVLCACAALLLSCLATGTPRPVEALGDAVHLTESNRSVLTEIAEAMRNRWALEEQRHAVGGSSIVLQKWTRREGAFDVSPPVASELRALTLGSRAKASPKPRRLSGSEISALPTPARRPREAPKSQGLPAPRLAPKKEEPRPQPLQPAQKEEEKQEKQEKQRHQENRREQLSFWPLSSSSTAGEGNEQNTEPEPLLELTHVLNMVAPRPQQGAALGASGEKKLQAPSVAAELLVSSALRMHWPADKRKLAPKDAAGTCREAAAVLQEAILQLSAAANIFESGSSVKEIVKSRAETKRRRTYAGPMPGAVSPPVGSVLASSVVRTSTTAYRGSPPVVRTSGLRV